MANANIVVWDPTGEWWEGALVRDVKRVNQMRNRGVVVLPIATELMRLSGVGGYHKRAWGAGWPLDDATPRHVAQMTIYCEPRFSTINWAARVVPSTKGRRPEEGFLRLAADGTQINPLRLSIAPDQHAPNGPRAIQFASRELGEPDAQGGWVVGGFAQCKCPMQGHYGVSLFGMMPGVRVAWAAVTQSE